MVMELFAGSGGTTGKGNSPHGRKLGSLPLTAIRFGSAKICKRFFCCKARMTAPIGTSVRVMNKLRKSEMLAVGTVGVTVVTLTPVVPTDCVTVGTGPVVVT